MSAPGTGGAYHSTFLRWLPASPLAVPLCCPAPCAEKVVIIVFTPVAPAPSLLLVRIATLCTTESGWMHGVL